MRCVSAMLLAVVVMACNFGTPNENPVLSRDIPDQVVPWDTGLEIDLALHFRDPDGNRLTYSATSADPFTIEAEVNGSMLMLRSVATDMTQASVTVTATDADGGTVSTSFLAMGNVLFYEDWDSPDALDDWEVIPHSVPNTYRYLDTAFAEVKDGKVHLYPYSRTINRVGVSIRKELPQPSQGNWTITAGISVTSRNPEASLCAEILGYTGHEYYVYYGIWFSFSSGSWFQRVGVDIDHPHWDPYHIWLGEEEEFEKRWEFDSKWDVTPVSLSFVDGIAQVTSDGDTLWAFDPLHLSRFVTGDDGVVWPPGEFPPGLLAIEIGNYQECGPHAPDFGLDPEDRNILAVDWILVAQEVAR